MTVRRPATSETHVEAIAEAFSNVAAAELLELESGTSGATFHPRWTAIGLRLEQSWSCD